MSEGVFETAEFYDDPVSCPKCQGRMVPLSDFGPGGSSVKYKAWVCVSCPYQVRIDKGYVSRVMRNPSERTTEGRRAG